jgi:hypothetical protein
LVANYSLVEDFERINACALVDASTAVPRSAGMKTRPVQDSDLPGEELRKGDRQPKRQEQVLSQLGLS